jgi:orotidine-5'-phosphate decarboxylase
VLKIGLQAFIANGASLVREVVARGERVFLDLKLHDIPIRCSTRQRKPRHSAWPMLTVHAAGGGDAALPRRVTSCSFWQ